MVFFYCPKRICIKKHGEEEKKEETIPDWRKVGNYEFKRIREKIVNYIKKGWDSKVGNKQVTMTPVKNFYKV